MYNRPKSTAKPMKPNSTATMMTSIWIDVTPRRARRAASVLRRLLMATGTYKLRLFIVLLFLILFLLLLFGSLLLGHGGQERLDRIGQFNRLARGNRLH